MERVTLVPAALIYLAERPRMNVAFPVKIAALEAASPLKFCVQISMASPVAAFAVLKALVMAVPVLVLFVAPSQTPSKSQISMTPPAASEV
jgi:hypothetical protein